MVLALGVIAGSTPIQVALVKAAQGPDLDIEGAKVIGYVFWSTMPLVCAVAVIAYQSLTGRFSSKNSPTIAMTIVVALAAGVWLGNWLGLGISPVSPVLKARGGGPWGIVVSLLENY